MRVFLFSCQYHWTSLLSLIYKLWVWTQSGPDAWQVVVTRGAVTHFKDSLSSWGKSRVHFLNLGWESFYSKPLLSMKWGHRQRQQETNKRRWRRCWRLKRVMMLQKFLYLYCFPFILSLSICLHYFTLSLSTNCLILSFSAPCPVHLSVFLLPSEQPLDTGPYFTSLTSNYMTGQHCVQPALYRETQSQLRSAVGALFYLYVCSYRVHCTLINSDNRNVYLSIISIVNSH